MGDFLSLARVLPGRIAWPVGPGAFRLFLAMLVFVHHFSALGIGKYAVYVFFVLSGFWVERMWRERYSGTRAPYLTYMVSRVWRLAPAMLLISALTIVLLPFAGVPLAEVLSANPFHLAFSTTFLLGYAWLPYQPVGSAWSLDVEMQFYLLAPFVALLLHGYWQRWAVLAVTGLIALKSVYLFDVPVLPRYLFFFALGMAASRGEWRPSGRLAAASVVLFVLLVPGLALTPWRSIVLGGAHPGPMWVWNQPYNIILTLTSIPFAIYTTRQRSDAVDRAMADMSYIVYLLHWIASRWFFLEGSKHNRIAVEGFCFVAVPLMSYVIWRWFDKPINHLRGRWVASRMVGGAAQAAPRVEVSSPDGARSGAEPLQAGVASPQ